MAQHDWTLPPVGAHVCRACGLFWPAGCDFPDTDCDQSELEGEVVGSGD